MTSTQDSSPDLTHFDRTLIDESRRELEGIYQVLLDFAYLFDDSKVIRWVERQLPEDVRKGFF